MVTERFRRALQLLLRAVLQALEALEEPEAEPAEGFELVEVVHEQAAQHLRLLRPLAERALIVGSSCPRGQLFVRMLRPDNPLRSDTSLDKNAVACDRNLTGAVGLQRHPPASTPAHSARAPLG